MRGGGAIFLHSTRSELTMLLRAVSVRCNSSMWFPLSPSKWKNLKIKFSFNKCFNWDLVERRMEENLSQRIKLFLVFNNKKRPQVSPYFPSGPTYAASSTPEAPIPSSIIFFCLHQRQEHPLSLWESARLGRRSFFCRCNPRAVCAVGSQGGDSSWKTLSPASWSSSSLLPKAEKEEDPWTVKSLSCGFQ